MSNTNTTSTKPRAKLESIMAAASALTGLGNEKVNQKFSSGTVGKGKGESETKRYIPEHKKPDAALTFPEKMMNVMRYAEEQKNKNKKDNFCVAWLSDGKSFVVRNPDEFTRQVLPKFFKATKFSSFTRKLYRWGFRQVNRGIGPDDPIIFGNEYFLRDDAAAMSKMRSITAASSRKAEATTMYGGKRSREADDDAQVDHKRAFLESYLQQKAAVNPYMHSNPSTMYAGLGAPSGAVSLTSALRPGMGFGSMSPGHYNASLPTIMSMHKDMMSQQQRQSQYQPLHQSMDNSMNHNLLSSYTLPSHQQSFASPTHMQQQPNSASASTAEIVNAAISALRYAS